MRNSSYERISSWPGFPITPSEAWAFYGSTIPSCHNHRFVGGDWNGLSFSGSQLDYVEIIMARLRHCRFDGTDFKSSGFDHAECLGCLFHDTVFRGVKYRAITKRSVFTRCVFAGSCWDEYEFHTCLFEECDFTGVDRTKTFNLQGSTLVGCTASEDLLQLFDERGAVILHQGDV
jgi:uncharacterized protein YjbI with pentapeptide repeats